MVFKLYKLMMLGQCGLVLIDCLEFWKGCLVKVFIEGLIGKGGWNNIGWIIVCCCGGGVKCFYCVVDFKWNKFDVVVVVVCIEYDLNCIVFIVLIQYEDGEQVYILVFQCLVVGDKVIVLVKVDIKLGNVMFFLGMFIGMIVYNIEMKLGKGGQIVCVVGIYV